MCIWIYLMYGRHFSKLYLWKERKREAERVSINLVGWEKLWLSERVSEIINKSDNVLNAYKNQNIEPLINNGYGIHLWHTIRHSSHTHVYSNEQRGFPHFLLRTNPHIRSTYDNGYWGMHTKALWWSIHPSIQLRTNTCKGIERIQTYEAVSKHVANFIWFFLLFFSFSVRPLDERKVLKSAAEIRVYTHGFVKLFFFEFLWLIDIFPMTYVCSRFLCERKVSFAHVIQLCIFFGWFSIVLLLGLLLPSQCDICFVPLYL